uniref:Uncharacterized protein n=1 Tax=Faxonius propinquus nudivirus TaxID=3139431 RepID=A0AAU8GCT7_9VIRU
MTSLNKVPARYYLLPWTFVNYYQSSFFEQKTIIPNIEKYLWEIFKSFKLDFSILDRLYTYIHKLEISTDKDYMNCRILYKNNNFFISISLIWKFATRYQNITYITTHSNTFYQISIIQKNSIRRFHLIENKIDFCKKYNCKNDHFFSYNVYSYATEFKKYLESDGYFINDSAAFTFFKKLNIYDFLYDQTFIFKKKNPISLKNLAYRAIDISNYNKYKTIIPPVLDNMITSYLIARKNILEFLEQIYCNE